MDERKYYQGESVIVILLTSRLFYGEHTWATPKGDIPSAGVANSKGDSFLRFFF
jgi:hypothetical protein